MVTLLGTRGSVGRAGPDTVRYGGDTSSISVLGSQGTWLVLDAGSGLLHLSPWVPPEVERIDILLTHLHMDHIQGLGFFPPLRDPDIETHIWGPASTTQRLQERLSRYLSPPLFPVRLRDLQNLSVHDVATDTFTIGEFEISSDLICHPGPTLGFRVVEDGKSLAYLPDHEPALGSIGLPGDPRWTSGFDLLNGADIAIHDAQYTPEEYDERRGWGHSTVEHAVALATQAGVGRLVTFHHDPEHSDDEIDRMLAAVDHGSLAVMPGQAGLELRL